MFIFTVEYFYIQVGKNKIAVLTVDEQNDTSHEKHSLVQIISTNKDSFSDEASSLWVVIRDTSEQTMAKCY